MEGRDISPGLKSWAEEPSAGCPADKRMPTFHQHARRVVNSSLPIGVRYAELIFCLLKLSRLARFWSGKTVDDKTQCREQRHHYNRRFGFDDTVPPRPEQLVATLNFAYAEYNKLRRVQEVIYRRRVGQKMLGRRFAGDAERTVADTLWQKSVQNYLINLEQ